MTKEEILEKWYQNYKASTTLDRYNADLNAMQEYSDLQNKELIEYFKHFQKDGECSAGAQYSSCHIHSDNVNGCLDCGNFKLKKE